MPRSGGSIRGLDLGVPLISAQNLFRAPRLVGDLVESAQGFAPHSENIYIHIPPTTSCRLEDMKNREVLDS